MVGDSEAPPDHDSWRRFRTLIVDDNRDAADTLAMLMAGWGFDARTAYDGRAALNEAASFHPDCFVLDIGMPGMRGDEVAMQLQNEPNRPYLVAITGWSTQQDQQSALAAGFDEVLAKPVAWQQIEALLMRLMTLSTDKECASANHLGRS